MVTKANLERLPFRHGGNLFCGWRLKIVDESDAGAVHVNGDALSGVCEGRVLPSDFQVQHAAASLLFDRKDINRIIVAVVEIIRMDEGRRCPFQDELAGIWDTHRACPSNGANVLFESEDAQLCQCLRPCFSLW